MGTCSFLKSISLFALLGVALSACSDDDDGTIGPPNVIEDNIIETAQGTDALSSLVGALSKADEGGDSDLIGTLSGEGPFTVFAPTNEAFAALFDALEDFDALDDFDTEEERALLASLLQYHVISGTAARSSDLTEGQEITTVQGEKVSINLEGGVFIQDATDKDARVVEADVEASNGIVHVIDKVLVPVAVIEALNAGEGPKEELDTLTEVVVENDSLSLLEAAVIKADLTETLAANGPFTVFAPTDNAFVALLETLGDDYSSLDDFDEQEEIDLLRNILLYHVIPDSVPASALAEGSVATAYADNSIEIIASGETFVIGDATEVNANITATDILASNGVAHTIDKVLLPQAALEFVASLHEEEGANIVETAQATDSLSLLVEALIQADAELVATLSGDGPFTVFAPSNEAFKDLLKVLGEEYDSIEDFDTTEEKQLLATVLTYHVVSGTAALSTNLTDGQMIETVQGESLEIILDKGTVRIDDATDTQATVITADIQTGNGVVHIIDRVLFPSAILDVLNPVSS